MLLCFGLPVADFNARFMDRFVGFHNEVGWLGMRKVGSVVGTSSEGTLRRVVPRPAEVGVLF